MSAYTTNGTSLVAQRVKSLPTVQETPVRFLGGEDSLEKEMAAHSSVLAWRIPRTEEPGGLQSMGLQESDMPERLSTYTSNTLPGPAVINRIYSKNKKSFTTSGTKVNQTYRGPPRDFKILITDKEDDLNK